MLNFGIDVSRDKRDCAVLDDHGQRVKRSRTFANDHQGVLDLIAWARTVAAELPRRFVMEATAAYHELPATRLHGAGLVVSVVNPAQVRSLARGLGFLIKTDAIDAVLLAHYGRLATPRPWRPVRQDLQQFNAMLMRLDCIEADLRREQNAFCSRLNRASSSCAAIANLTLWADNGRDFYAPIMFANMPDQRVPWMGWSSNWEYARELPTQPWRGQQSAVRELSLVSTTRGLRLRQCMAAEMRALVDADPLLSLRATSAGQASEALSQAAIAGRQPLALIDGNLQDAGQFVLDRVFDRDDLLDTCVDL